MANDKATPPRKLPTYQQLAELLISLVEMNVSNVNSPEHMFVACFTFQQTFPDLWLDALNVRRAMKEQGVSVSSRGYKVMSRAEAKRRYGRGEGDRR
jgi:hypothetical protein